MLTQCINETWSDDFFRFSRRRPSHFKMCHEAIVVYIHFRTPPDVAFPFPFPSRRFFDAGKNGDGIPLAPGVEEEDADAVVVAAAEVKTEAEAAANTTAEDWQNWVAAALAMDKFTIMKKSKKGNSRKVDLRPQLLGLEFMDQGAVDVALQGKHIPIPPVPQPGTALLKFKGEYTGAGGLSVDGMAKILSAAAGKELQVLHSHRVAISLDDPTPPKVDKLWLDNIVRAEAFMGLERIWDPEAGTNNRGHMAASSDGDRIDNHKQYRRDGVTENENPEEKKKDLPPGRRSDKWKKK